ncbi:hypothetical protein GCM10025787_26660 [Saccharopolyspora rosea]|uniref:Uncharacterized protein n=1 Tax=Saccharopolyspora rosea TaxID=524884 RepID=A0ABW3FMA0_9PSEU
MDSGSTSGWSGRLDLPARRPATSRHGDAGRRGGGQSVAGRGDDEAGACGLQKFDLGMVPASVTPPRTWRRAAWFAISTSAAALGGLVAATTLLVGHPTSVDGLHLPGLPRGRYYPPLPAHDLYYLDGDPSRPTAFRQSSSRQPSPREPAAAGTADRPTTAVRPPELPAAPSPTTTSPEPVLGDRPAAPPTTTRPPTSEAPYLVALSDVEEVELRSESYFSAIARGDVRAAYALTTGDLREEGFASFATRYEGAVRVEVLGVSVRSTSTVNTIRITEPDGTARTERRRLTFSLGDDPLVNADDRMY